MRRSTVPDAPPRRTNAAEAQSNGRLHWLRAGGQLEQLRPRLWGPSGLNSTPGIAELHGAPQALGHFDHAAPPLRTTKLCVPASSSQAQKRVLLEFLARTVSSPDGPHRSALVDPLPRANDDAKAIEIEL